MKQIHEVAKISGVSVRTLRHYDEIGLLCPARRSESGYRLYTNRELERLGRILFLRELDFSLKEIAELLNHCPLKQQEAFMRQKELLVLKRRRLTRMIALLDELCKGGKMDMEAFSQEEWKKSAKQYEKEVKERWGDTEAFLEYQQRAKESPQDTDAFLKSMDDIFGDVTQSCRPDDKKMQRAVSVWQAYISAHF